MRKFIIPTMLLLLAVASQGCFKGNTKYVEYIKPLVNAYQLEISRMSDFENQPFKGMIRTAEFYEEHKNNLKQIQNKLTISPKAKALKWKVFHSDFDGLLSKAITSGDMTSGAMTSVLDKIKGTEATKTGITGKKHRPGNRDKKAAMAYLSNRWEVQALDARKELAEANQKLIPFVTTELKILLPDIGDNKLLPPLKKCFK